MLGLFLTIGGLTLGAAAITCIIVRKKENNMMTAFVFAK
jgi:hypothetical protein